MKVILRLAMFVATLLLAANISFAASCDEQVCYVIDATYQDGGSYSGSLWTVCLNDNGTGSLNGLNPLYLFGESPLWSGFDAHPKWTTWIIHHPDVSGHLWTDIYGMSLNGEGYSGGGISMRWKVTGKKVPCP